MPPSAIPPESIDPLEARSPRLGAAFRAVSAAARSACDATLPPGVSVRIAAARLGVSRQVAWSLLTLARALTPLEMAKARLGRRGWKSVFAGLEEAGCPAEPLATLRDAAERVLSALDDPEVAPALGTLVDFSPGRSSDREAERRRVLRKAHFATRAASVLSSRGKVLTFILTRNRRDPLQTDLTATQYFDAVERGVPGDAVLLGYCKEPDERVASWLPDGMTLADAFGRGGAIPSVIEEASSPGVVGKELQPIEHDGRIGAGFTSRDPRRSGTLRIAFGEWLPARGGFRSEDDDEIALAMNFPGWTEFGVFDVLWHRRLESGGPFVGSSHAPVMNRPPKEWKIAPRVEVIGAFGLAEKLDLPEPLRGANAGYRTLVSRALSFLGEPYENFEHWRYVVECPPLRSMLLVRRPMARG